MDALICGKKFVFGSGPNHTPRAFVELVSK